MRPDGDSLVAYEALTTAYINDVDGMGVFAQHLDISAAELVEYCNYCRRRFYMRLGISVIGFGWN